jgi:hypothetical protein
MESQGAVGVDSSEINHWYRAGTKCSCQETTQHPVIFYQVFRHLQHDIANISSFIQRSITARRYEAFIETVPLF